jgi:hypothetical protein
LYSVVSAFKEYEDIFISKKNFTVNIMFTKKIIRKLQMKNLAFDGMFSGELLFDWSCLQNIKNCFSAKNGGDGL